MPIHRVTLTLHVHGCVGEYCYPCVSEKRAKKLVPFVSENKGTGTNVFVNTVTY